MFNRSNRLKDYAYGFSASVLLLLCGTLPQRANAQITNPNVLINGLGGPAGYGELSQEPNDDGSSNLLDLPFTINFFGNYFNEFWINNNGNLTFESPLFRYTPEPFPVSNQPMIAPYWADVDTRCQDCGAVYVGSPNSDTVVVTWDQVGYYDEHSDKTNTFQVVLRNRSQDFTPGDFDIEFRYGGLNWTTGDASGGSNGLGGTPAQAGFDAGDGINFSALPGSFSSYILNLVNSSNLIDPVAGIWSFAIRQGSVPGTIPGTTPSNPLLPVVTDNGWEFNFNIQDPNIPVFIDPLVGIGYDYVVDSGPNIASVLLPTGIGDNNYELWLFNPTINDYENSGIFLTGGNPFTFSPGGVNRFSIRGIEVEAGLDPNDVQAFVTGLTFVSPGQVSMRQIPQVVPEPFTIFGVSTALGFGSFFKRRVSKKQEKKSKISTPV
ncbi:PEP-CTERM sorting domain-containing protein [Gloeothece verrucosa]|uniref:Nidogen, extracellular region n=1 Tax=Gloeothece verrucosa (strain PCC 7822) TaxID=497965 RepID=E0UBC3_GLOV7|nr:PEP-CTERM sorting domain-containing protein [Gloeothece verrucosa]ADN12755.1 nidogen, extracellular region [Gloeothece verrucosa PCC 7822]